jgi:peroxiredoxin Q/BCP
MSDTQTLQDISNLRGLLQERIPIMTEPKLKLGEPAPEFALPDDTGHTVKLSDYRGKRVVIYFYPKDDTPGCTTQACGFRDNYLAIEEKNAVVLGISPDDEKSHVKFKTKFNLPFTLLCDVDHAVADAYGVWGEKSMMGKTYMGIIRSHFVVDENGQLIDVQVNIKPEASVAGALEVIRR